MTSEIKENEINTSNEEVTHLKFIGDRASDYDYELFISSENINLLENFLELICNKQKTSYTSSLRSLKITHYFKLSDNKILCILCSYPNITSLNFEQSKSFTDASLIEIARSYPNLESLNVCGNQDITGHSIYKIAKLCQKIRHLDTDYPAKKIIKGMINSQVIKQIKLKFF